MANSKKKSKAAAATVPATKSTKKEETTAVSTAEEESPQHFDVAQHVYEGAKGVWAFGKGIGMVKPFLGLAEGVASKVVGIATGGMELTAVDDQIKPHLAGLDDAFVNPAISAFLHFIGPAVAKGDEVLRPVVMTVGPKLLGPLGLMKEENPAIKEEKKTDVVLKKKDDKKKAESVAPELTTPTVAPLVQ